jgi:potassium-transporting ATPase KdpC subunit
VLTHLRQSVALALICLVFFGLVYGFVGTGVAQVLFHHQADGSITANGSTLIGQQWGYTTKKEVITRPQWFHGRPDEDNPLQATGKTGESFATNLGAKQKALEVKVHALVVAWHKRGVNPTEDLVTTSGSNLDPDITPADAMAQIPMVSRATGISPARLKTLISQQTNAPELGFLGSSYIVVLQLNEALAKLR